MNDAQMQLAARDQRYNELAGQFHALANVAEKRIPSHMNAAVSTVASIVSSAVGGAIEAYANGSTPGATPWGTVANAVLATAALGATVVYKDNANVIEGGHAIARGLAGGVAAIEAYKFMGNWLSTRVTTPAAPAPVPAAA